jgi:hypothetical protein
VVGEVAATATPEGQEKIVGYLEAVLEEVLFETKAHTRGAPRLVTYRTEGR